MNKNELFWEKNYKLAQEYYEENGDLLIPIRDEVSKIKIGVWISTQRTAYIKGILTQEQINQLEDIGMIWDVLNDSWVDNYKLAKQYYNTYGDLLIPARYEIDGIKLGRWIKTQRKSFNKGTLIDERINKLELIGMI